MEDGFPLFDPNDEAARQEQKLLEYYGEFSANARRRLLAKTIVRPITVYDILYPQTRQDLLSKNTPFNTDLEESAKIIRDKLIAKFITNETDLEKISEDFRNSLLARAKIQQSLSDLSKNSDTFRKNMLSKNQTRESDIETDSSQYRRDNISKNRINPSSSSDLEVKNQEIRDKNISKNSSKGQDLLIDSESFRNQFRKNDIHKNVSNNSNLEKDSESFRNKNLSKNSTSSSSLDIDSFADEKRMLELSKNSNKENNLEVSSESFRDDAKSKNVSKEHDLLNYSEEFRNQFRKNDIHKNVPDKHDIEKGSNSFRKNNLAKNVPKISDIEKDSVIYRNSNIINSNSNNNIDEISEEKRSVDLSKNKPNSSSIEKDSVVFRDSAISKNTNKTSDLEVDSFEFRKLVKSKNKLKDTNIEIDSVPFRKNNLSTNKLIDSDLQKDSEQFRIDDLSANVLNESDLEKDSVFFRNSNLIFNKTKESDLESDSISFRKNVLSFNSPNNTSLEIDSIPFRSNVLSFNKPSFSDLENDSISFRSNVLSFNLPNNTNIEVDSIPFRNNVLSFNSPIETDIESDSILFRENVLSFNSPNETDLATDSTPYLYNNISSNVPNFSNLEIDSVPFRENVLSSNVPNFGNLLLDSVDYRENNISSNVLSESSLSIDSIPFRQNNLSPNVPKNSNIIKDSEDFRENNLSSNVSFDNDLLIDSKLFRDNAISKNQGFGLLGVNVQGAGTSAFLGISRVFTQGILVRQLLFSKNKPKFTNLLSDSDVFRDNNISSNKWQYGNDEYSASNVNWKLGRIMQGSYNTNLVDYSALEPYYTPTAKAIFSTDDFMITKGRDLQNIYGSTQRIDFPTGRSQRNINDALYSVNTKIDRGGEFLDGFFNRNTFVVYTEGLVTRTMRKYSQERNAFNLYGLQPGNPDSLNTLNEITQDGFQDLVSKTIGSFKAVSQLRTITTPADIITKNQGAYYPGGGRNMDILKPGVSTELGSADSMMAKTVLGNPFEDEDFFTGRRGVKHVVNTIKNSNSPLSKNFDPQNNRAYITGSKRDGSARVSRQRFTIANPYAPGTAGKLLFSIKNYSSGDQYFFPPYIQSMANTEAASWNTTSFLGRPEAVYTYNNSSRDGSISFYVLTDYTQKVDVGRNWGSETMDKITANIDGHFTQSDYQQNRLRRLEEQKLEQLKDEKNKEIQQINDKITENSAEQVNIINSKKEITPSDSAADAVVNGIKRDREDKERIKENNTESAALSSQKKELTEQIGNINNEIGNVITQTNIATNYSETSNLGKNIYDINISKREFNNGEIISKPEDTINRIDTMKAGLMFQPAYFSGDKVDFVRKIEFLSKLTRPAAAYEGENSPETGFSFTKPPICHIQLGDWWNHDIVVNSVSFDYADAPWTFDGNRVQPMWALVSISFNIIGPFGSKNSRPPLSTDKGGMYSPINGISKG